MGEPSKNIGLGCRCHPHRYLCYGRLGIHTLFQNRRSRRSAYAREHSIVGYNTATFRYSYLY